MTLLPYKDIVDMEGKPSADSFDLGPKLKQRLRESNAIKDETAVSKVVLHVDYPDLQEDFLALITRGDHTHALRSYRKQMLALWTRQEQLR